MINTLQNAFLSGLKNNTDTPKSCLHHGLITLFNKAVLNWEISAVLRRLHSSSSTGVCGGVSYLCTKAFTADNFLTHIYTNILIINEDLSPTLQQLITLKGRGKSFSTDHLTCLPLESCSVPINVISTLIIHSCKYLYPCQQRFSTIIP